MESCLGTKSSSVVWIGMQRLWDNTLKISVMMSSFFISLIVISVTAGVISRQMRWVLGGTQEVSQLALVAVVFLGFAYTQRTGNNVRTMVLVDHLPERICDSLNFLANLCGVLVFGAISFFSWLAAYDSIITREFEWGILQFPLWPVRTILFIGCVLLTIQLLLATASSIKKLTQN